jgi:chemotaxis protein histidine kinase CheA
MVVKLSKIESLPVDIKRYIYKFVSYENKFEIAKYFNKYLTNQHDLINIFNTVQLKELYKHCIVEKISYKKKDVRDRFIINELLGKLPETTYSFIDEYGFEQTQSIKHPLIAVLDELKKSGVMNRKCQCNMILRALNYLMTMKTHITDIDYKFQQIAYNMIKTIKFYKERIEIKNNKLSEIREKERLIKEAVLEKNNEEKMQIREEMQEQRRLNKEMKEQEKQAKKEVRDQMRQQEKQYKLEERYQKQLERRMEERNRIINKLDKFLIKKTKEIMHKRDKFNKLRNKIDKKLKHNVQRHIIIPYTFKIKPM